MKLVKNELYKILHKRSTKIFLVIALIFVILTNLIYRYSDDLLVFSTTYYEDYDTALSYVNDYENSGIGDKELYNYYKSFIDTYDLANNFDSNSWQYQKYMEDYSLLNEKKVFDIVLWEKFLVFATAFGIADKVIKQLKIVYPDIDQNIDLNHYAYFHVMMHTNFSTGFVSSVSSSMSSAYSSGTGGGGGFSGGGGGGRRPEVEEEEDNSSFNYLI